MIKLSDRFTYKKLLRATFPSILMMLFTSLYTIVDGLYVSNFVGKIPFAAINLIMPIIMIIGALGFMMGAGGAAIVSKTLGEGDEKRACGIFTGVVIFTAVMGVVVSIAVFFCLESLSLFLGATKEMLPYCLNYGRIIILGQVTFMVQNLYQNFFIVAERPLLGFGMSVLAGVTNMILDAVFIIGLDWGIEGAAAATVVAQTVGAVLPTVWFAANKKSLLRFARPVVDFKIIAKVVTNGSSELLGNVSASLVSAVYNIKLLEYAGENGVAAYGVIMYANFVFAAVFIGYAIGSAPIVGYHYGAKHPDELKNLLKKSMIINFAFGGIMTVLSVALARVLTGIFVGFDPGLHEMTAAGMRISAFAVVFVGNNMFISAFFTALNNGLVSGIVSATRTLVFQIGAVLLLPIVFGLDGIWAAVIVAEVLAFALGSFFLLRCKKRYGY